MSSQRSIGTDRTCLADCREFSHELQDKLVALLYLVRGKFEKELQIIDYLAHHLPPVTMRAELYAANS